MVESEPINVDESALIFFVISGIQVLLLCISLSILIFALCKTKNDPNSKHKITTKIKILGSAPIIINTIGGIMLYVNFILVTIHSDLNYFYISRKIPQALLFVSKSFISISYVYKLDITFRSSIYRYPKSLVYILYIMACLISPLGM